MASVEVVSAFADSLGTSADCKGCLPLVERLTQVSG